MTARDVLVSTFEQSFDQDRFMRFMTELCNGAINDSKTFDYVGQYIPDAFKDQVLRYKRLGTYTDPDGEAIDILVVFLRDVRLLDQARTLQRTIAAYHLKKRDKQTALIAYVVEGHSDWRFSLVRREQSLSFADSGRLKIEEELTPVRRYSFLLGAQERSHTAQQQLLPLMINRAEDPTLQQFVDAFNIETVTKEFFEKYKQLFLDLKEHIEGALAHAPAANAEFARVQLDAAAFAKKLLGQIVFLYFLQKKGWLGVDRQHMWGTGSKHFLRETFEHMPQADFFNDVLEPLFYDALALQRPDDLYVPLDVKIPFLNGGLFEPINQYAWRTTPITIPRSMFEQIFATFDLYNFTIREDEPLEKEVAVDPEMLGKVFENLLEISDRKSKGAFYTPREIVHYMCQESLIQYLMTTLPQIAVSDLEQFVRLGEFAMQHDQAKQQGTVSYVYKMPDSIREHAEKLDQALAQVTVCDPAIGSGAFPVGMMQEIVKAREVLATYLTKPQLSTYELKRHAIQASIYGVDIDQSALDIAKLRLWLSLVVDEDDYKQIKPLPNLDYKIVGGNSLLQIENTFENHGWLNQFEALKKRFFDESDRTKKHQLRTEINEVVNHLTDQQRRFDVQVWFSEVFKQQGFDIIIANPPYVRQERIKEYKHALQGFYPLVYAGTADLFVYFYAQGFNMLKSGGVLAYITPNKFMRANYGKKVRGYLAKNVQLERIIDFGDLPVFDATTYPLIMVARKQQPQDSTVKVLEIRSLEDLPDLHHRLADAYPLPQSTLSSAGWQLVSPDIRKVLAKIKADGTPLGTYVNGDIYYGIKTGFNEAFVITQEQKQALIAADPRSAEVIKPYLRGRDVKRWHIQDSGLYLILLQNSDDKNSNNAWASAKTESEAVNILKDTYPAIFDHMMMYEDKLRPRSDQGKWFWELRACAYYQQFDNPKIIYPNICSRPEFTFDSDNYYTNQKCFIIPSSEFYLLGLMNSYIMHFYFKINIPQLRGGYYEPGAVFMKDFPIPNASEALRQQIAEIAQACLSQPEDLAALEAELNRLVYQAYGLNQQDQALIEAQLAV